MLLITSERLDSEPATLTAEVSLSSLVYMQKSRLAIVGVYPTDGFYLESVLSNDPSVSAAYQISSNVVGSVIVHFASVSVHSSEYSASIFPSTVLDPAGYVELCQKKSLKSA